MSALSSAQVTGLYPTTLEQLACREAGTPADCMIWHQVTEAMLWRADLAAAS